MDVMEPTEDEAAAPETPSRVRPAAANGEFVRVPEAPGDVVPLHPTPEVQPSPEVGFTISDTEFRQYAQGRRLLSLLRLTSEYRGLLAERARTSVETLDQMLDHAEPDDAVAMREAGRASVLRIGGYQVWQDLFWSARFLDLTLLFAFVMSASGALICTTVYSRAGDGAPLWASLLFFLVALICSTATLFVALLARDALLESSRWAARSVALGGVVLLGVLGLWLWRLNATWSLPLAGGAVAAMGALAILGLGLQLRQLAMAAVYRRSWTAYTADEITETLIGACGFLRMEPWSVYAQANAGRYLQHVAHCVEEFLPAYLASDEQLRASTRRECVKRGAGVRELAVECLVSTQATQARLSAKTAELLTLGIQGRWGDWDVGDVRDVVTTRGWRRSLATLMQVVVGLAPILVVGVFAAYLNREHPESELLSPEVIGPLAVAAFGWFTTFVAGWLTPNQAGRSAGGSDGTSRSPANPRAR
ncbi:membrane hypothetical protein [metagenome]|uniref:Uncharacterized protein n=1 Tax=metagenome TaxID=256318 RepID=A0A2P2CD59_9ZZZZ